MQQVSELEGAALDAAVAKALGWATYRDDVHGCRNWYLDGKFMAQISDFTPSTSWAVGGPIIERENLQIGPPTSPVHRIGGPNAGNGISGVWSACTWHRGTNGKRAIALHGTNPLIAAMRAFVRSKLGDTLPDA